MKITTLIAAAALATASTAATAQNVTTTDGDVVVIEKNTGPGAGILAGNAGLTGALVLAAITAGFIAIGESTGPSGGSD